jgi:sodium transport system permease protein
MKLWSIFYKELLEGCRDRRAMLIALSFALLGPVVLVISINAAAQRTRDAALTPFALCGGGSAPALIAHLQAAGLTLADSADICLEIPEDYAAHVAAGKSVQVQVRADLAKGNPTTERLEREINTFSHRLAGQRLMARGIAPQVIAPIRVEMQSTNGVSRVATGFGTLMIMYVLLAPFIVVFAMAADTSAGERERKSLQPLLTHSVPALHIVAGKFLALAAVNVAGTAVCVAASLLLIQRSAVAELGLRVATDAATGFTLCLWLTPLALLVAAAQLAFGLFAKTAKEAQQTLWLLSILPVFAGMALMYRPGIAVGAWPLIWEVKALAGPLLGATASIAPFPIVALLELGIAALLLLAGAHRLRSESVLS